MFKNPTKNKNIEQLCGPQSLVFKLLIMLECSVLVVMMLSPRKYGLPHCIHLIKALLVGRVLFIFYLCCTHTHTHTHTYIYIYI